jgi:hypothetical protein
MTLLGSWAGSVYIAPAGERAGVGPITARHYLCDACRIPLRVEYCPAHQQRLVVPPLVSHHGHGLPAHGKDKGRRRPHQCPELGCTYEKSRDEAPVSIG